MAISRKNISKMPCYQHDSYRRACADCESMNSPQGESATSEKLEPPPIKSPSEVYPPQMGCSALAMDTPPSPQESALPPRPPTSIMVEDLREWRYYEVAAVDAYIDSLISHHAADTVGLRKRVHFLERHNQHFERCESAWCHPDEQNNPAQGYVCGQRTDQPSYEELTAELERVKGELAEALSHPRVKIIEKVRPPLVIEED